MNFRDLYAMRLLRQRNNRIAAEQRWISRSEPHMQPQITVVITVNPTHNPMRVPTMWAEFTDNDPTNMQLQPEWSDQDGLPITPKTNYELAQALHNLKRALQMDTVWQQSFREVVR